MISTTTTVTTTVATTTTRLSLQSLLLKGNNINRISEITTTNDNNNNDDTSTYFCSQLVAEGLKQLLVIDNNINSKSFWPGSFACGDLIDKIIINGYSYSDEIVINFTILEIAEAKLYNNTKVANNNNNIYYQEDMINNNPAHRITTTFTMTL